MIVAVGSVPGLRENATPDEDHKSSDQEAARMAIHERMNQVREHLDSIDSDLEALRRIEEEAGKA